MKTYKNKIILTFLIIFGMSLISGCGYSEYWSFNFDGSKSGDEESFTAEYKAFNDTTISNTIDMNGYSILSVEIKSEKGYVEYTVTDSQANVLYTHDNVTDETLNIPIDYSGIVNIEVTGCKAKGSFRFQRVK